MLALPVLVVVLLTAAISPGEHASAAAVTLHVRAGDGTTGYAVNTFLPNSIYIRAGDTVTWDWVWPEPHSVTFGTVQGDPTAPSHPGASVVEYDGTGVVNSGFVIAPTGTASFSVTFTKAGTYDYYCFLHPFMTGKVYVQGPGVGEQDTQASVDARGAAQYTSDLAALKAAAAGAAARPVAVSSRASGGRRFTVAVSTPNDVIQGDVQQFFPPTLSVGTNDEVEFVSAVHTPHDVAFVPAGFNPNGPPPPALADWDPFQGGIGYQPGVKVDGKSFVASPIIGLGYPDGQKASFTFAAPGTYTYICALHANQGMVGTVTVAGAPAPPNTGTALAAPPDAASGRLAVVGAVLIALGATAVAFASVARRVS
jgi:plastocyanin